MNDKEELILKMLEKIDELYEENKKLTAERDLFYADAKSAQAERDELIEFTEWMLYMKMEYKVKY